jgi:sec-independent protein translocase protein TatB
MNFLGVGPFELVLVLGLALIVLGPERMQEMGRTAGRLVARLLAWQQRSPEARMIQEIRQDFEREIVELRDELVRAKQQVDLSKEVQRLRQDANSIMSRKNLLSEPPADTPAATPPVSEQPARAANTQAASPDVTSPTPDEERSIGGTHPYEHPTETRTVARRSAKPAPASSKAVAPTAADYELLQQQVQALAATVQALQEQLREQGMLAPDWQPPAQDTQPSPPSPSPHETVTS